MIAPFNFAALMALLFIGLPAGAIALVVVVKFIRSVSKLLLGHYDASPRRAIVLGGIIVTSILLGWIAMWFYQAPNRVTQAIWEDAIVRAEFGDRAPDWTSKHFRGYHGRCPWEAHQNVSVNDGTPDRAEIIAASYEADGWDVTRMVDSLDGKFEIYAIKSDRSQRVKVLFGSTSGMSISATHSYDSDICPLATIDQLNYDEERSPRVDTFPAG